MKTKGRKMDNTTIVILVCLVLLTAINMFAIHKLGVFGLLVLGPSLPVANKLLKTVGIDLM